MFRLDDGTEIDLTDDVLTLAEAHRRSATETDRLGTVLAVLRRLKGFEHEAVRLQAEAERAATATATAREQQAAADADVVTVRAELARLIAERDGVGREVEGLQTKHADIKADIDKMKQLIGA